MFASERGFSNNIEIPLETAPSVRQTLAALGVGALHGTASGCLSDVLDKGLIATGIQTRVSFCGEMMGGILPQNLSSHSVSLASLDYLELALSYADKNLIGWHPSRSATLVSLGEQWMREGGASEMVINQWRVQRHAVEEARVARWELLSEEQRFLVSDPFPVVIGISHQVVAERPATNVRGELAVSGVPVDQLTFFVADDRVEFVKMLASNLGKTCPIHPLSSLSAPVIGDLTLLPCSQ